METGDLIQFVQHLEIDTVIPRGLLPQTKQPLIEAAAGPSGFIDDGSVVACTPELSKQAREDVLNSTLLAQLAANKKFNREEQTKEWYGYYHNVLENIGWVLKGFQFVEYDSSSASFTVDKVAIELLAAIATGGEAAALKVTLDALKKLPADNDAVTLFNTASHKYKAGSFQLSTATKDKNGDTAMSLGAFTMTTKSNVTRILFFKFGKNDVSLYYSTQSVVLNEQVYSRVRQAVLDKLGKNAETFVKQLPDLS